MRAHGRECSPSEELLSESNFGVESAARIEELPAWPGFLVAAWRWYVLRTWSTNNDDDLICMLCGSGSDHDNHRCTAHEFVVLQSFLHYWKSPRWEWMKKKVGHGEATNVRPETITQKVEHANDGMAQEENECFGCWRRISKTKMLREQTKKNRPTKKKEVKRWKMLYKRTYEIRLASSSSSSSSLCWCIILWREYNNILSACSYLSVGEQSARFSLPVLALIMCLCLYMCCMRLPLCAWF